MRTILFIFTILLFSAGARAHNPLAAKFELDATLGQGAILNIYLSQTGLHQALIKHYAQRDFDSISESDYKELAVRYIKEHIRLKADNTALSIAEGGIKLGNHQTDLKFFIENIPGQFDVLDVEVRCFAENENHHSVFWLIGNDFKEKAILSARNGFRATFVLTATSTSVEYALPGYILWLGLGLGGFFVVSLYKQKKKY